MSYDPAYHRAWRERNPEKVAAYAARWRAKNPGKAKANSLEWRNANLEHSRAASLAWSRANPDKKRAAKLMREYGITPADVASMLTVQNHTCPGCTTPLDDTTLNVDHDHETGKVRGLLCWACNIALGQVSDNPETLRRLADYLT